MQSDNPLLAIYMITYNHEAYIEQAVESVMMQETKFPYKLFIGDDCSTDKTSEICRALKAKYPDKIDLTLNTRNIGAKKNANQIFGKCFLSGAKYIALLEGDDYWTDASKLQIQVDFLETNTDCSFCFHRAFKSTDEKISAVSYPKNINKAKLDAVDFFKIPTIPTASVVFRNEMTVPDLEHYHGDTLLYCEFLSKGRAGFIDRNMSVYRLHQQGISSAYNENWYLERRIMELGIEKEYRAFSSEVRRQLGKLRVEHIFHYLNKNRGKLGFKQKQHYFSLLVKSQAFYRKPIREYLTLLKTLVN